MNVAAVECVEFGIGREVDGRRFDVVIGVDWLLQCVMHWLRCADWIELGR